MAAVGGSDSHTLANVARAFTTVAGARNKAEFLAGLRRGLTVPCGRSGTYARLTAEVGRIFAAGYKDALHGTVRGLDQARNGIQQRCLSGSVRTDQRHDFTKPRGEGNLRQRSQRAEVDRYLVHS